MPSRCRRTTAGIACLHSSTAHRRLGHPPLPSCCALSLERSRSTILDSTRTPDFTDQPTTFYTYPFVRTQRGVSNSPLRNKVFRLIEATTSPPALNIRAHHASSIGNPNLRWAGRFSNIDLYLWKVLRGNHFVKISATLLLPGQCFIRNVPSSTASSILNVSPHRVHLLLTA